MTFQCEDLRDVGLILVSPSSTAYPALLADIRKRIDHPTGEVVAMSPILRRFTVGEVSSEDRATSAILLNRADKSIAAMQLVWRYEEEGGRIYSRSRTETFGKRLLLPFTTPTTLISADAYRKIQLYWNTIMPGSKRYVGERGMAGDNTDVRPPEDDEIWKGGGGGGSAGGTGRTANPVRLVTLILDGVFFIDGEFIGPNRFGLWESITREADARLEIAKIAHDGRARGIAATDILNEIGKLTGPNEGRPPAPPPPGRPRTADSYSWSSLSQIAFEIARQRQVAGDERTVEQLASQADIRLPDFRKR